MLEEDRHIVTGADAPGQEKDANGRRFTFASGMVYVYGLMTGRSLLCLLLRLALIEGGKGLVMDGMVYLVSVGVLQPIWFGVTVSISNSMIAKHQCCFFFSAFCSMNNEGFHVLRTPNFAVIKTQPQE
ncbi:hypothetical protein B0T09DRAFT_73041 [Sordaria sp. MPI-SDFR-AT-0083]|nr:hypothetical protein B0T09DRAFT_73041 [Sordaria sp. MPI-SDFR-AT-0083]